MRRFALSILTALAWMISANLMAQDSTFATPSRVINAYFDAISETNDALRSTKLKALFIGDGQMNATVHRSSNIANQKLGTVDQFLNSSSSFYNEHNVSYDERERSIEFYQDIALVHSLVFQVIEEKAQDDVLYNEWIWMAFNLAYAENRWWLTTVSWVNSLDYQNIDEAMLQDTLWHNPEK